MFHFVYNAELTGRFFPFSVRFFPAEIDKHPVMALAAEFAAAQKAIALDNEEETQYFMKDLDILVDVEPCFMCAMALIHSRISRLYFMNANTVSGGLCTKLLDKPWPA